MQRIRVINSDRVETNNPDLTSVPDWVLEAWEGLEFPITGEATQDGITGYVVRTHVAMEALEAKSPEAARWIRENAIMMIHPYSRGIIFPKQQCELIA